MWGAPQQTDEAATQQLKGLLGMLGSQGTAGPGAMGGHNGHTGAQLAGQYLSERGRAGRQGEGEVDRPEGVPCSAPSSARNHSASPSDRAKR